MRFVGVKFAPADNESIALDKKDNHYYDNHHYVQKSWFGGLHLRIYTYRPHP